MSTFADAKVARCVLVLALGGCSEPVSPDEAATEASDSTGAAPVDDTDTDQLTTATGTDETGTETDTDEDDPTWLDDIEQPLPERLSEVGVFASLDRLEPSPGVLPYAPVWPLYSSGSEKLRFLALPQGATIEVGSTWEFPVGTVLVKTFTFDDLTTIAGTVPIETRLLFRRASGWDYALYHWNDAGTDATLLEDGWLEVPLELPRSDDPAFPYVLPARLDCRTCHETSEQHTGTPVLGIGPHQIDAALAAEPVFSQPPALSPVEGRTAAETLAFGYFVGNCISCHNGGGGPNASFSLYPDEVLEQTIDRPVEGETMEGIRVVPGDPDSSAVFITVVLAREPEYTGQLKPMPPIGITRTDPDAETLLRAWIEAL